MALTVEREMTISAGEFLRILPRAAAALRDILAPGPEAGAPAAPYTVSERAVVIGAGPRRVEIRLCERGERRLGAIRLPVLGLRFEAFGLTEAELGQFMARFDSYYQRMGG